MTETTNTPAAAAEEPRKDKRRPFIAFALAALAIGGIGAAATSAAWTDNVFFSADAKAATFNLQGSVDGGQNWAEGDDGGVTLVVPADKLANLLPGETRTIDLEIKNLGTVGAALTSTVAWELPDTDGFVNKPKASIEGLATTLGAADSGSDTDAFQLTVTTKANWAAVNQGTSGTIVITIKGTAVGDSTAS